MCDSNCQDYQIFRDNNNNIVKVNVLFNPDGSVSQDSYTPDSPPSGMSWNGFIATLKKCPCCDCEDTEIELKADKCDTRWATNGTAWHRRFFFGGQVFPNTTNFNSHVIGYVTDGTFTAECDGMANVFFGFPWIRTLVRSSFIQAYIDVAVIKNGALVANTNYTSDDLIEENEFSGVGRLEYDDHKYYANWNVPVKAGDTIAVRWRIRCRRIQPLATPAPYTRLMVYRRHLAVNVTPNAVVDVTTV